MKSYIIVFILSVVSFTSVFAQSNELLSTDKKWTIEDYKSFSKYLNTIPLDSYPTLKNEKTKALFQKLISSDYKDFLRDEAISFDVKGPYMMNYQKNIREIFGNYLMAYMKEKVYGIELMYLQGVLIDTSAEMIPLLKVFIKTLDKNDETYQVRMNGIQQMKLGLKQQVEGALMIIKDSKDSTDEERIILSKYFLNAGEEILNFIDASDTKEFKTQIEKHLLIEPNKKIKALLSQLLSKV